MFRFNRLFDRLKSPPPLHSTQQAVYRSLERLQKTHALIFITVDNSGSSVHRSTVHQSIILAVDPNNQTITIDELFPGGYMIFPGQMLSVSIRDKQNHSLTFKTRVVTGNTEDAYRSYTLALPDHLDSQQRRAAFRLPTQGWVKWEDEDIRCQEARMLDLSATGVSLQLEGDQQDQLSVGAQLHNCELHVKALDLNLNCDINIARSDIDDKNTMQTRIGGKFLALEPYQRRRLEHYLMRSQRHQKLIGT